MRKNVMAISTKSQRLGSIFDFKRIKDIRCSAERHCSNAQKAAEFLEAHDAVKKVNYPGLPSHPQYELAQRQMRGMGGIVSFEIKGGVEAGKDFIDHLDLAMISFSLGDPETLVQHPASMTHSSIPEDDLENFGIQKGLIRLSAGLEDAEDIIADLEKSLARLAATIKS